MTDITPQKPFDSIRCVDEQGNEFWHGRELMPLLQYQQWRRFEETIERAKISCQIAGNQVDDHFEFLPTSAKTPAGGRPGSDYKLSRYACHLVAMNGDVRKPAIALAQSYFSVKATESELKHQQPQSTGDMLVMFAQAFKEHEERLAVIEQENQQLKEQLEAVDMETTANTAELERFRNGHGFWFSVAGWCSNLGVKKSAQWMNMQGRKAAAICRAKGIQPVKVRDPRFGTVNTYPDSILCKLTWD